MITGIPSVTELDETTQSVGTERVGKKLMTDLFVYKKDQQNQPVIHVTNCGLFMHMDITNDEIKLYCLQPIKNLDKSTSYANAEANQGDFNILTDKFNIRNRLPTLIINTREDN